MRIRSHMIVLIFYMEGGLSSSRIFSAVTSTPLVQLIMIMTAMMRIYEEIMLYL